MESLFTQTKGDVTGEPSPPLTRPFPTRGEVDVYNTTTLNKNGVTFVTRGEG